MPRLDLRMPFLPVNEGHTNPEPDSLRMSDEDLLSMLREKTAGAVSRPLNQRNASEPVSQAAAQWAVRRGV